ncbi:hypothetical protein WA026_015550 [Henosepilachna vigintioctopunctata]|uniref:Uncharacterized protein n=1 Tax=Henosepilachna vigintioctopunctata TaxID=420089 RepID=A0AAW1VGY0_9CUCU
MELDSGICGICDAKNEIINPKDSEAFWETIGGIFKNQFDKKLIEQTQLKICLTCIFHANLIDTKKHILKKLILNIDSCGNNKCRFCKTNSNLLKVENSAIFKTSDSIFRPSKGCSVICACCYYVIKANYILQTNLLNNLSECSSSTLKDGLHSIKTEVCSDDDSSTFSKSKKNPVDGSKECGGEIMIHSDILIEKNKSKDDIKLPNEQLSQNIKKGRNKKVDEKVENAKHLSITNEDRKTRKRKLVTLSNKDLPQQLKKPCMQIKKANDLDMSSVICLSPLCKTTIVVNEAIKQDSKFYNCVPYVQVPIIIKSENHCSDIPEHIAKKKRFTEHITKKKPLSPLGIIKRTPPIKIKLKKITKFKKGIMEKKHNTKNLTQDKSSPTNTIMFDEFKRKEVVVKVERMILPTDEKEPESHLENTESETSVVAYESVLKNTSIREETPKKKKKVHFNDTPTIIITADELSDDSTNEEDISTKKMITNGKILKFEEETTDEQYSFKIDSEESDDEIALTIHDDPIEGNIKMSIKEETKISSDKKKDSAEVMEIDSSESESDQLEDIVEENKNKSIKEGMKKSDNVEENIELTAIDISNEEPEQLPASPNQLNDQVDTISPGKESGDETVELENSIVSEETHNNIGEVNVIVENVQAKENNLNQENSSVEESMEIQEGSEIEEKNEDEKISIEKINTVNKNSLEEAEITLIEDSDNETPDEITSDQVTDGSAKKAESEVENNEKVSETDNVVDVEKKQGDELDATKIVVNDIVLSEATTASEDFGSLIDEVQKCLTSKDESPEDVLEVNDSPNEEVNDETEKDEDLLSCLNDID